MEHNLGNTPVQEERPGRMLIRRLAGRARTVACAKGAVNRRHPGLSSAHAEGLNRRLRLPAT